MVKSGRILSNQSDFDKFTIDTVNSAIRFDFFADIVGTTHHD